MTGGLSWISIKDDATWAGEDGGGTWKYARITGETMTSDVGLTALDAVLDDSPGQNRLVLGFNRVGGTVSPEALFEGVPWILMKHAFGEGSVNTTGPTDTVVYTHNYNLKTALTAGFTMEVSKGDVPTGKVFKYVGCMVDSFTWRWEPEDLWSLEFEIIARDETPNTTASGSPSFSTAEPIYWFYDAAAPIIAGYTLPTNGFKSATLTINNNLDGDRFLMSKTISQPIRGGKRMITGQVVMEFEDLTAYNKIAAETEGTYQFETGSNPEVKIPGSGGSYYFLNFTSFYSHITGSTPTVQDNGIVEATFDIVFRDGTLGALTAQVRNAESSIGA